MEKVLEILNNIKDKIIEFWNKYTAKQKTIIIIVFCAIVLGLAILAFVLNQTTYTKLRDIEDTTVLTDVLNTLDTEGISYKTEILDESTKTTRIMVDDRDLETANNVLVKSGYLSEGMTWDKAFSGEGMSTSSDERQTKYKLALQNDIRQSLLKYDGVQDATVILDIPKDDNTWAASKEEASVSILLSLRNGTSMTQDTAKGIAYMAATAVGNSTTDKVIITDSKKNLLFGKMDGEGLGTSVNDVADFKLKLENQWEENIGTVLMKQGYDEVDIIKKGLIFDMDKITELQKEYTVAEGNEQGYKSSDYSYKATGANSSGGIPGTDSNADETDTMIQDNGSSNTETTLTKNNYLPNELVKNIEREQGALKKDESSMGIVVTRYKVVREETLKDQGALDQITWEEYCEQNKATTNFTVPQEAFDLVSAGTGIPTNKLTITGIEKPVFESQQDTGINVSNYLMIVLAVLIAALLVFVIVKGTSPVEVTETEPELSVEDLLQTTAEPELEDIEIGEKSELLRLIDKFVEDNPEATALLLRNWINDDWG